MSKKTAGIFLALLLSLAAIEPIRSYDYFWHLATGRWIVEHHALPATDPFGVASERIPWINGEWLFEIGLSVSHRVLGDGGWSIARGLFVGALFTFVFWVASKRTSAAAALLLTLVAWQGADHRLGVRPEAAATFLLAAAIALLMSERTLRNAMSYALLAAVWMNVHPSALLAPALAALWGIVVLAQRRGEWSGHAVAVFGSALALLVNPHGWRGVIAPIRLATLVRSGEFVNLEWLPSAPSVFPLLYLSFALGIALFAANRERGAHLAPFLLFLFLAVLAARFLRNQGLFFAVMPMLLAPLMPRLEAHVERWLLGAAAGVFLLGLLDAKLFRAGIDEEIFPVRSVARLAESRLEGNIYNPDQFGGFLIWTFYPDRRVLTDGRNELYREYIVEYGRARGDSRLWNALLEKYDIALAVDEYREPIEVIDATTGRSRKLPASLAYYPRTRWALIAYDEKAMVFANRDRHPAETLARLEIRDVVPDFAR
ncbi:MAG TPA: hypothetical protein VIL97_06680 [Thermoanaerobaculia bacterium]